MSTDTSRAARRRSNLTPRLGGPEWLDDWDREDAATWDGRLAWTTLAITTYTLTLSFITWFLVSAIAPKLNSIGFSLTKNELYWLAAMPGLAGGLLRLVWMFLPPWMGTRKLVALTTLLLVIPLGGWAWAVQDPATSYSTLLGLAFLCGIGGGAFSGFMPSTSYFFPKRMQGTALGLQAGIGNFGVSVVQFLVPWVIGFALLGTASIAPEKVAKPKAGGASELWLHNAGMVFIPWVIVGAIVAWLYLRSVPIQATLSQQLDIFSEKHTWLMTLMYIMTFGAFSGFSGQFGLLIKNQYGSFADAPDPLKYAFLGPLVGSAARVLWGPLCDRFGGGIWTTVSGVGMTASTAYTALQLHPTSSADFGPFLWGMLGIFFFAGIGNAATFKQMPMIFPARQAGGVIGWTAAIAAFGPFIFGVALASITPSAFFWGCAAYFAVCVGVAYWYYARPGAERKS